MRRACTGLPTCRGSRGEIVHFGARRARGSAMRRFAILAPILILASCSSKPSRPAPAVASAHEETPPPPAPAPTQTQVEMVNVKIRLDQDLILNIRQLHGRFIPTRQGQPPTFD